MKIQTEETQHSDYHSAHLPAAVVFMALIVASGVLFRAEIPMASVVFIVSIAAFMIYLLPVIPLRLVIAGRTSKEEILRPLLFALCFSLFSAVVFFRQYEITPGWLETTALIAGAGFFISELPQIIRNFDKWQFKAYFFVGIAYLSMWSWM